ncbi:MAG: MarR family transcriptional regulator [Chitinophagales bacterium]|nr:MarR family transcriptional regulator [Chitinophagales bacterium]
MTRTNILYNFVDASIIDKLMSGELNKKLDEVYIFHLEKAYKQFRKFKTDYFKQRGVDITSDQWILLKGIHESEGISQRSLAEKSYKEPASVTRILDKLESRNWIERKNLLDDRRSYGLYVTDEGRALVERLLPMAVEIRATGTKGFTDQDIIKLNQMLIKLFENFS